MGRTIIADEAVQSYISTIQEQSSNKMGIVIGQVTNQKDFVFALAVTPDDEADGMNVVDKAAREPGREHGRNTDIDLSNIDSQWLTTHALQVNRMLVGGVDIVGVFVVGDQVSLNAAQNSLRQCMYAVYKRLGKAVSRPPTCDYNPNRLLLMINSTTKRMTCRTYDISDQKASATPADCKFQSLKDKWIPLHSQLRVDIDVSFEKSLDSQLITQKIQTSTAQFSRQIELSQATVNNMLCLHPDTQINTLYKQRDLADHSLEIHLFNDHLCPSFGATKSIDEECCSKLSMFGTICGRAYVHAKATFAEAINAMKIDLVRSLTSRCELLCEDIEITEGDSTQMQFYKPPSRVFAYSPTTPIPYSDYIFADEEPQEVVERLTELLDITLPVSGLELNCENYPDDIDISTATPTDSTTLVSGHSVVCPTLNRRDSECDSAATLSSDVRLAPHSERNVFTSHAATNSWFIIASALFVIVVSILVFYFISGQNS